MKMYNIKFQYADALSNFEWRNQECDIYANDKADARKRCIELYGLGLDCNYRIVSIEEVE